MVFFFYKGIGDFVSAYCNVFVTQSCTTFGDFSAEEQPYRRNETKKKNKKINKNPNKYEKKKYLELKIPAEFYLIFLKNYNKAQKIKIKENKGT